jgi:hypothetical protein
MSRRRLSERVHQAIIAGAILFAATQARAQTDGYLDSIETFLDTSKAVPEDARPSAPATLRLDTAHVERRVVPAALLARFREDEDFDYGRIHREPVSLWDAIMRRISKWFRDMLGDDGVVTFWEIVAYVILGASLIFVAIKLSDADARALFFRKKKESDGDTTLVEEDVHGIDYPSQIERAVAAGDLRLAVRLHYLRLLRDLSERGAIAWRPEKTDADYARELRDTPLRSSFERASLLFEYVWYGDFPIDRASYERLAAVIDRAGAVTALR